MDATLTPNTSIALQAQGVVPEAAKAEEEKSITDEVLKPVVEEGLEGETPEETVSRVNQPDNVKVSIEFQGQIELALLTNNPDLLNDTISNIQSAITQLKGDKLGSNDYQIQQMINQLQVSYAKANQALNVVDAEQPRAEDYFAPGALSSLG